MSNKGALEALMQVARSQPDFEADRVSRKTARN